MRCPQCQVENHSGVLLCIACGHRLFAWLGDPFGNLERGQPAAAQVHVLPAAKFPWGKAVIAGVFVALYLPSFKGWALLVGALVAAVLWRGNSGR